MSLPLKNEVRRCRPLLGTFVEISAAGVETHALQDAINAAFAAIERIHCLMSIHSPDSEISRLNGKAARQPVRVSQNLFTVLSRAHQLALESKGAFDPAIAPTLARWGFVPVNLQLKNAGTWRDVLLLPGRRVRFSRPLALDLGGIAKGFAVDKAIETLRQRNVTSALVNAGGDLRVFGPQPVMIHLRHPAQPHSFAGNLSLHDGALATSSPCFSEKNYRRHRVSHLVNPLCHVAITGVISVTVRAKECWLADALTKVVLNAPETAQKLLAKYDAQAYVLSA